MKVEARNMREANIYLDQYCGDKADNRPNALLIDKTTFSDYCQQYLAVSKYQKTDTTFNRDLSHMKPLLAEWGSLYLYQINTTLIQNAQAKWLDKGLSKKTVNNRCVLLSAILRMAYKRNLLVRMPEIPKFKLDKRPPEYFTDDQLELMQEKFRPSVWAFVIVLLHTGLRTGELKRLEWKHVDFKNSRLVVEVAKSHRFRVIPLNVTLEQHLLKLSKRKDKGKRYVFEGKIAGQPFSDFSQAFKRELEKLGIDGHLHILRHTFASRLVQKRVSIFEVKELLGHASVQTTQVYSHIRNEDLSRAVMALEGNNYQQVLKSHGTATEPSNIIQFKVA